MHVARSQAAVTVACGTRVRWLIVAASQLANVIAWSNCRFNVLKGMQRGKDFVMASLIPPASSFHVS